MKKCLCAILALASVMSHTVAFADMKAPSATQTVDMASKEYTNPIADRILEESENYDTSAFEGVPAYVLQDPLCNTNGNLKAGLMSGWDTDTSGGGLINSENKKFQILDSEENAPVTLTKKLMPHKSGKITFETAFSMNIKTSSGFSYELLGGDKKILKLQTENDKIMLATSGGTKKQLYTYKKDEIIPIKAIIDMDSKTYELILAGINYGKFEFLEDASVLDRIWMGTTKEDTPTVWVRYVHIYLNYAVNETFMSTPVGKVPYDWTLEGGGTSSVAYDPNMVYPDEYSFVLYDPTTIDSGKLSRTFDAKTGKAVFESRFLFEQKAADTEIYIGSGKQKAISIKTNETDILMGNGTILEKDYLANFWYTLKIVADIPNKKADIYLNYKKVLSDVPFENNLSSIDTISFGTALRKIMNIHIDDVKVYDDIALSDYVPAPTPVERNTDIEVGMQMYSMWNEGNHFGWDWITAYEERIPYLGTYSESNPEVADWVTKWQVEHGFTFRTEIFSRAVANINEPVKLPTRYHAMFDGYFNSKYKDQIKFSVLYSGINKNTLGGLDDFKNNVVPFFIKNFFTQPNYLLKDNKPVLFMYGAGDFATALGGMDKAEEAIAYLDSECKKAGFDGVFYVPDGTSNNFISRAPAFAQGNVYSYGWQYNARTTKTQLAQNDIFFASGANVVGNVSMGFGRAPWCETNAEEGGLFATPQTIKETILGLKERFSQVENPTNIIMLTCWDEYGEGHFFAPTRVYGFEYLNAVREAVTDQGAKKSEDLPTPKALARMDSLYFGGRRMLKYLIEKPSPEYFDIDTDPSKLQVLAEWDFEKMTDIGGWKAFQDVKNVRLENGALVGEAIGGDPGVWIEGLNIKASDVHMLKITTQTDGAGKGQFFFQTTDDTTMGSGGKRFDVGQDDDTGFKEYTGVPYDRKKLKGYITAVRWDPKDNGFPDYTTFKVKKIQILGYPTEEYQAPLRETVIPVTINGATANLTRPPLVKDGITYIAPSRLLQEMKIKNIFDYNSMTYTIEVDGNVAVLTAGSKIMKLNGVDVDLGAPCYYEDGNFFVPLRTTLEKLGFTVSWNNETSGIDLTKYDKTDTYPYLDKADTSIPFSWMFETRNTEDWTANSLIGTFKTSKGALVVEPAGNDPYIFSPKITLSTSEYKYLRVRMKNTTGFSSTYMLFITTDQTGWGDGKRIDFTLSTNDTDYKEYIIPLDGIEKWKGTVTQVRFDVVNPVGDIDGGKVYVDSIEFLKELPK